MEPIDLMGTDTEREEVKRKVSKRRRVLLIVMLIVVPVYLIFLYFGEEDIGRTASLVLGVALLASGVRWDLRKHVWFWATVAGVYALHLPLILKFRWPDRWISGVELAGIGLPDFLIFLGCIWLVEKVASAIKHDNQSMNSNRPLG